jgi:hypothetical protein
MIEELNASILGALASIERLPKGQRMGRLATVYDHHHPFQVHRLLRETSNNCPQGISIRWRGQIRPAPRDRQRDGQEPC